jgi:tRNA (guanine37-N1)-methyltransferase
MQVDIITVVPDLLESPFAHSMMKRAIDKGHLNVNIINLRDYSLNNYNQVDDYQYGGGAGMVLMVEPLSKCIEELKSKTNYDEIIFLTPDGPTYKQAMANALSLKGNLLFICGHYKGIDQRIRDKYVSMEISVGDYVLTGGELAVAIVVDSILRLIPGVLGNEESALFDSHQDNLLAPPVYSRPAEYDGMKVPEVLLSGNFPKIDEWRMDKAIKKTEELRPDMLD